MKLTGNGVLKIIGAIATVVSFGATIALNWVQDKELDEKVARKVAEAMRKMK